MKRRISLALACILVFTMLLGGCGAKTDKADNNKHQANGNGTAADSQTDSAKNMDSDSVLKDGKMTELTVVFPSSNASPAQLSEVEAAMNTIIQKTVDAKVKLQIIEWGAYQDQINLMLSSGEKMDMFFAISNLKDMANKGQLVPITDLVDKYAKKAKDIMSRYLDACYFNSDLYGFPTYRDLANQGGLVCRQDILKETDMKAENIKSWDDLETLLKKVKELHPDMYPLIPADVTRGCLASYNKGVFDIVQSGVGAYINDTDGQVNIINTYDTKEYLELAEKAYEWNEKGYFMPDSTTTTAVRQDLIRSDKGFGYIGNVHPGTVTQETMNSGKEMVAIPLTARTLTTAGVNFCQWVLPIQCESPEKTLAILNMLYTDPDMQNLFRYGIEGKDYVVKDAAKGIAGYPDGVDSKSAGWSNEMWMTGNASIGYAWETDPEDVWNKYATYNDDAVLSPLYGFVYDSSNVKTEISAISNVTDKYTAIIEAGLTDPESTVKKLNDELKGAGIQNIIDDMQKQADEWSKTK